MRMKNKGFTLIEFMIAIAMAGIIALGLSYMMVSSSRNFTLSKNQVSLQSDAQIVMNSISDYLLQGNNASFDDTTHMLTIYHSDGNPATYEQKEIIWHNPVTKRIYICSPITQLEENAFLNLISTPTEGLENYLLGLNVEEFTMGQINKDGILGNGVIEISIKFSLDNSTYTISNSIKLRNEIKSFK